MRRHRTQRSLCAVALFVCWATARVAAAEELPQTDNTLGIGDAVEVTVVGYENEVKGVYRVTPAGNLEIPYVGTVPSLGKSYPALTASIEARVHENYLHHPQVIIRPIYSVSVLGNVNRPGAFEIAGGEHLSRLIAMAGGSSNIGTIKKSTVTRGGKSVRTDLEKAIKEGRTVDDLGIRSGDVIFVPRTPWYREFQSWALLVSSVSLAFAIYDRVDRNN